MEDKGQEYRYRRVNLRDDELEDKRLFQQACVVVGQKEKVCMWLINKKAVREYLLKYSKQNRNGRFTRVSNKLLHQINARVADTCIDAVMRHPSVGKTLTQVL